MKEFTLEIEGEPTTQFMLPGGLVNTQAQITLAMCGGVKLVIGGSERLIDLLQQELESGMTGAFIKIEWPKIPQD